MNNINVESIEVLPEKSWIALGRISKFLKSKYPFPDPRSGAYGYESDRDSMQDLFLLDLEELVNYLKCNPMIAERDLTRLKETFLNLNIEEKSITQEQLAFLSFLNSLILRI